jgi:hypothetical protein
MRPALFICGKNNSIITVFKNLHFCIFPAPYEARFKIQADERKKFQASFFSRKSAAGIFSEEALEF